MLAKSTVRASWWVLALLGALAPACKSKQPVNGQCVFNSDCDETQSLICAGRYCRQQCNLAAPAETRNRDCPSGTLCQPAAQQTATIGACLPLGDNGYCVYASECAPPLVCNIDGRCSSQCRESRDCQAISLDPGSVCEFANDVGTCSFRDGGTSTPVDTGSSTPADAGAHDAGGTVTDF
ncbi:MAG: hypothetical protein JWM10_1342 [Myxococcaceae bacterium]|nr:hypothetical protein [Myxococcaceae bacterium]